MGANEVKRCPSGASGESFLLDRTLNDEVVFKPWNIPVFTPRVVEQWGVPVVPTRKGFSPRFRDDFVIGIRSAGEGVEAVLARQKQRQVTQVPFAEGAGRIPSCSQMLGECNLISRQPAGSSCRQYPATVADHAASHRPASRQQRSPTWCANVGRGVKIRPALPLRIHAVEPRGLQSGMSLHPQIAIPLIVGQYHHEVGQRFPRD
jgi:hypothetical protein